MRLPSFTIKSLLILSGCVAVVLGSIRAAMQPYVEEEAIISALEAHLSLDAKDHVGVQPGFTFDDELPDNLRNLLGEGYFRRAIQLQLPFAGLHDADINAIARLGHLRTLSVGGNPVTDSGIAALSRLKRLRTVNIEFTEVSDVGLLALAECPTLEHVSVGGSRISPDGIRVFKALRPNVSIETRYRSRTVRKERSAFSEQD